MQSGRKQKEQLLACLTKPNMTTNYMLHCRAGQLVGNNSPTAPNQVKTTKALQQPASSITSTPT
jgi:hypothetical protein